MRKFKMFTALVLALALVLSGIPTNADAAAKKSITVSTQKELIKALNSGKYTVITFKSDKKQNLKISSGSYPKISLIIDAPLTKVTNEAITKKIEVLSAKKISEKTTGNKYVVKDKALTMTVADGAEVKSIKTAVAEGKLVLTNKGIIGTVAAAKAGVLKITDNGQVEKVALKAPVSLVFKGSSEDVTNIVVAKAAEGSSIAASTSVKVEAAADADITFNKGAEQSEVVATSSTATLAVDNNTTSDINVTASDGSKDTVASGEETKDAANQEAAKDDTAKDETAKDETAKDETSKDDTSKDTASDSSSTGSDTASTGTDDSKSTDSGASDSGASDSSASGSDSGSSGGSSSGSGSSSDSNVVSTTIPNLSADTTTPANYIVEYQIVETTTGRISTGSAISSGVTVKNGTTAVNSGDTVAAGTVLTISAPSGYTLFVSGNLDSSSVSAGANGAYSVTVSRDVTLIITVTPPRQVTANNIVVSDKTLSATFGYNSAPTVSIAPTPVEGITFTYGTTSPYFRFSSTGEVGLMDGLRAGTYTGTFTITATGSGSYTGTATKDVTVTATVAPKTVAVSDISTTTPITCDDLDYGYYTGTIANLAPTAVSGITFSYAEAEGNESAFSIDESTGDVSFAAGAAAGNHTGEFTITATGITSSDYTGSDSKTITVNVTVKTQLATLQARLNATGTTSVELSDNLTIAEGETLTIPAGKTLTIPADKTLTNNGTIDINGTLANSGTLTNNHSLTNNGTMSGSGTYAGAIVLDAQYFGDRTCADHNTAITDAIHVFRPTVGNQTPVENRNDQKVWYALYSKNASKYALLENVVEISGATFRWVAQTWTNANSLVYCTANINYFEYYDTDQEATDAGFYGLDEANVLKIAMNNAVENEGFDLTVNLYEGTEPLTASNYDTDGTLVSSRTFVCNDNTQ